MRLLALTASCALALLPSAATAQWTNQSEPFALGVFSSDPALNESYVFGCHEGPGYSGLCITKIDEGISPLLARFNFSESSEPEPVTPGVMVYEYVIGDGTMLSQPMGLVYNVGSNVAVPIFGFSGSGGDPVVAFAEDGTLQLLSPVDDTKSPVELGGYKVISGRWHVCETYVAYRYITLAWTLGPGEPQNPSCKPVEVKRVFQ